MLGQVKSIQVPLSDSYKTAYQLYRPKLLDIFQTKNWISAQVDKSSATISAQVEN